MRLTLGSEERSKRLIGRVPFSTNADAFEAYAIHPFEVPSPQSGKRKPLADSRADDLGDWSKLI